MKAIRIGALMLAIILVNGTVTSAQPKGMHGGHGPMSGDMEASFDNLRLLKLMETLNLSEEQSEQFMPIFYKHRKAMKDLGEEKRAKLETLDSVLETSGEEQRILDLMSDLDGINQNIEKERQQFRADVAEILTVYQRGRMALFQEHFARRVLESLREFRNRGRQKP
jgi:Spy/CpxP family protein refolding chaperone